METKINFCSICANSTYEHFYSECYNFVDNYKCFYPNIKLKQMIIKSGWGNCADKKITNVILAFAGSGKTYIKEKYKCSNIKILDSDSSCFDKTYFPQNYIENIKSNIGKFDIILVSTHKDVRHEIFNSDIMDNAVVSIVYPNINLKEMWIDRLVKRGNNDTFIKMISDNWNNWINEIINENYFYKIELDEYFSYLDNHLYKLIDIK